MPSEIDEYAVTAHDLVDHVIENAMRKLQDEHKLRQETMAAIKFDLSRSASAEPPPPPKYENFEVQNIEWLTIEEFSIQKAEERISEFLKTWDYQDSWLYCIDFLHEDDLEFDVRYRFRVRWSIPTRRKPIPRATASVYFTFGVSKIKPKNYPVDVYYVFETNRLVHRPGFSRFREKWLKDIIESKVLVMQDIDF